MFSVAQKQQIAAAVEKILLDIGHPEMPTEKPWFFLKVVGKEDWSYADIEPNWRFADKAPGINPWNEMMEGQCKGGKSNG